MRFCVYVFNFVGYSRKKEGDGLGERGEQWTEILSWEPRAFLYHNFLVSLDHVSGAF